MNGCFKYTLLLLGLLPGYIGYGQCQQATIDTVLVNSYLAAEYDVIIVHATPRNARTVKFQWIRPNRLVPLAVNGIKKHAGENKRLVASALTIALGPFGAHRLYLGTEPEVPVAYTLTLGGGLGILPVIDLGHILFTKDLSRYENNVHVFMWGNKGK